MPQQQIFKTAPAVVTIDDIKVGTATGQDMTVRTNSQKTPADGGLVVSKGFQLGDVSINTIVTTDGQEGRLVQAARDNRVITVLFTVGGNTISIKGTFDEFSRKSIVDRGTTDGSYKMSGAVGYL